MVAEQTRTVGFVTERGEFVSEDELRRFVSGVSALAEKAMEESKQIEERFAGLGTKGLVTPPYAPSALIGLSSVNTYHRRAITIKAQDIAGNGFRPVPIEESDAAGDIPPELVEFYANLTVPFAETLEMAHLDFEGIGWATIELLRPNDDPQAPFRDAFHLPAHRMRVHTSRNKWAQSVGDSRLRWFKVAGYPKDVDFETGEEAALGSLDPDKRASEIMVWHNHALGQTWYGVPDIEPAIGAITGDTYRRDYNLAFFSNYGVPAYAVVVTGDFEEGQRVPLNPDDPNDDRTISEVEQTIRQNLQQMVDNPYSVLTLVIPSRRNAQGDGGVRVELKPLSVETKDSSFQVYRKDNRDEVLAADGVSPYRMGIVEVGALGGDAAMETAKIYKESIVNPRQSTIEGAVRQAVHVAGFGIEAWTIKLTELNTDDMAQEMESAVFLFDRAALTPMDLIRRYAPRFGAKVPEDPHPALEAYYLNGQPVTIDLVGQQQAADVLNAAADAIVGEAVKHEIGNGNGAADGGDPEAALRVARLLKGATRQGGEVAPGPDPEAAG